MEIVEELLEIKRRFPRSRTALLPTLNFIQDRYGYIREELYPLIEDTIGVSKDEIEQVISFYQFLKKDRGKIHIQICTNLVCLLNGAEKLVGYLTKKIGNKEWELVSYETVECIGCDDTPPAALINRAPYGNLTPQRLDEIIKKLKEEV